ncbi:MAG: ATP-binding protein [Nanoarchaeota archaeon]|nr:ATP-binding protein [Nanoarchaeota archaeon]
MEVERLKHVIEQQRNEIAQIFQNERIIAREKADCAAKFLMHPNILAILGIRRCGKSIFSNALAKQLNEKSGYINFDDERLIGISANDLDLVLQAFYELYGDIGLVILDEIQNITGWELFANRLRRTKKVIITGSNSMLLEGELATKLTGRYIDFAIYPFSFREFLDFKPNPYLTEDAAKARGKLKEYISGSGFPEYRKFGPSIVAKIYGDIVHKDCIKRHKIKKEKTFRELANYIASNFSCEITYSKLSNIFKIKDVHTTKNYVSYLAEAYLINVLERYSPKLKQQVIAPKKVYNMDQGLCNFIGFNISPNRGKLYENIVYIDLMRRKSANVSLYYWKDHQQNEVDFVVKEGTKVRQLIQVCFDIKEQSTQRREIDSLIKASSELKCNNLLVITDEKEAEEKVSGKKIRYMPLWKWLLEK